jgi:hypothetical protein
VIEDIPGFVETLSEEDRSRFIAKGLLGRYYVYVHMYPNGAVFYVGKGTGARIDDHEREARNGMQSHKCNVIRKIWAEGGQVIKQKVAYFDTEQDAYRLEMLLIKFFGRENLTNYTDGGERGGGAPLKGSQARVRVTRSFSSKLLRALESITDNQSEFIEEWMWEHPELQDKRPEPKRGYIELRLRDDQIDLQDQINEKCKGVWFPTPREPGVHVIGVSCETDTAVLDELGVEYRHRQ